MTIMTRVFPWPAYSACANTVFAYYDADDEPTERGEEQLRSITHEEEFATRFCVRK